MWPFKRRQRGRVQFVKVPVRLQGKYDAAQTTPENRNHWAAADGLSADSANGRAVRETLRKRARYEVANNSYAKGIVLTLANYCVGTGPRLQLVTEDAGLNRELEQGFADWSGAVDLAGKLRTMRMAKATDGEAFGLMASSDRHGHEVKLDLRPIEADQVTTPIIGAQAPPVDGIELDSQGNPIRYHVLRNHPGGASNPAAATKFDKVDAASMVHWFRADRAGQHRGVPEITAALPLFAQLRRYTLAVIQAAETAAEFTLFLRTNAPPGGEAAEIEEGAFAEVEVVRNMLTTLPEGWDPFQLNPTQPATTYAEFKKEILNEIARCVNMPYNIAACNSAGYNYASWWCAQD